MKTLKQAVKARKQVKQVIRRKCPECLETYKFNIYSRKNIQEGEICNMPEDENYVLKISCSCHAWELYGPED